MDTDFKKYHEYLLGRNWKGHLYRRFWLYPLLNRYLKGRTLDVGCGIGDFLVFRPGTVGIDINPYNVEYCHQRGLKDVYLDQGNWTSLGTFESVILDNVIEHLEDPKPLLSKIAKVTNKGGRLLVGTPGKAGYLRDEDHKIFYDAENLVQTVTPFGFEPRGSIYIPFKSEYLSRVLRSYCLYILFEKLT